MITTPYTFIATSTCVMNNLGVPVYTDIDPNTYNMDANQIERLIPFPATADRVPPELLSQSCHSKTAIRQTKHRKPSGRGFRRRPKTIVTAHRPASLRHFPRLAIVLRPETEEEQHRFLGPRHRTGIVRGISPEAAPQHLRVDDAGTRARQPCLGAVPPPTT